MNATIVAEPLFLIIAKALCLKSNTKKLNIKPKSTEYDILVYELVEKYNSDIISQVETSINKITLSKIKLNKHVIFNRLFVELNNINFKEILTSYVTELKEGHTIECQEIHISMYTYFASSSLKDPFLNLATKMLSQISINLLSCSKYKVRNISNGLDHENDSTNCNFLKSFSTLTEIYYSCLTYTSNSTNFENSVSIQSLYLTTTERRNKLCNEKGMKRIECGSFQILGSDGYKPEKILIDYLSNRYQELMKQAQERLQHDSSEIEKFCQDMVPFIVVYDFFSSSTPFKPQNPSAQCLRDSVFIYYNVARIAQIQKVYNSLSTTIKEIDVNILSLEIEWEIACHLINFYKIFQETILLPFQSTFQGNDSILCIHKLLQYILKLVRLFSKYYSSTKIVTYDMKESLVIRMNTRMLLVNSIFNVLVFTLRDIFGVTIMSKL